MSADNDHGIRRCKKCGEHKNLDKFPKTKTKVSGKEYHAHTCYTCKGLLRLRHKPRRLRNRVRPIVDRLYEFKPEKWMEVHYYAQPN